MWQYEFEKNQYNIFILEGHPVYEEVFLSGSFVGEIVLWNIEMKVPIRKFQEWGVDQRDIFLHVEAFDGKFSYDGKMMAIWTSKGTFSIYSMYDEESYCATPIEQFFIKREQDESHLSIEQQAENQVLVKADYIAHIHQPPYPILGKFRELKLSPIDYAILYDLRKEVYGKEHKFHNSKSNTLKTHLLSPLST